MPPKQRATKLPKIAPKKVAPKSSGGRAPKGGAKECAGSPGKTSAPKVGGLGDVDELPSVRPRSAGAARAAPPVRPCAAADFCYPDPVGCLGLLDLGPPPEDTPEALLSSMEAEWVAPSLKEHWDYVLGPVPASAKQRLHTGVPRDDGREGWTLQDFLQLDPATQARLTIAHVVALRLYTGPGYTALQEAYRSVPCQMPVTGGCLRAAIARLAPAAEPPAALPCHVGGALRPAFLLAYADVEGDPRPLLHLGPLLATADPVPGDGPSPPTTLLLSTDASDAVMGRLRHWPCPGSDEAGTAALLAALQPLPRPAPLRWVSQFPQVAEYAWAPGALMLPVPHTARAASTPDVLQLVVTSLWHPTPLPEPDAQALAAATTVSRQLHAQGWSRDLVRVWQTFLATGAGLDAVAWQDLFALFDPRATGTVAAPDVQHTLAALRTLPLGAGPIPSTAERLVSHGMKLGRYNFDSFKAHLSHPDFLRKWHQAVKDESVGTVTMKFSAYTDSFSIKGGRLSAAVVDEKWAISFAFSNKAVMRLQMPDGSEQAISLHGTFEGLEDGVTYTMECDEDDEVLAKEVHRPIRFNAEPGTACPPPSAAFHRLTAELKQLSPDDLRAQAGRLRPLTPFLPTYSVREHGTLCHLLLFFLD